MRKEFRHVQPGGTVHVNELFDVINALGKIRGDGKIQVRTNACGVQIFWNGPPDPKQFLVVRDTPKDQGYVTAQFFGGNSSETYQTPTNANDVLIYDMESLLTANSYSGPGSNDNDPQTVPFYGNTGTRLLSNWTKQGFAGRAVWDGTLGKWLIERIDHVARWINFSYGSSGSGGGTGSGSGTGTSVGSGSGTGKQYVFGTVDPLLSVTNSWHGLDPTKTTFTPSGGGQAKTNQIVLVNSPDGAYQIKSGNSGTAVWRDDLDNTGFWQYQVVDGPVCQ